MAQIIRCTRERYDETLRVLSEAFGFGDVYWFCKNVGHVCPTLNTALDEDIEKHYITLVDGKVVAVTGCYHFTWKVSYNGIEEILKLGGIGQVACLKEYRKRGYMSAMIKTAIDDMTKSGLDGSWLQGERMRYKRFGWDFAGNTLSFKFAQKEWDIISDCIFNEYTIKIPDNSHIDVLNMMYSALKTGVVRTQQMWERRLQLPNTAWRMITRDDKVGYICLHLTEGNVVTEVGGDTTCIMAGVAKVRNDYKLDRIYINYPLCDDETALFMYRTCRNYSVEHCLNLNIFNTEVVFEKLKKFIYCQAQANTPIAIDELNKAVALLETSDKEILCRRLLGYIYAPIPQKLGLFSFIEPVLFWLPRVDDV